MQQAVQPVSPPASPVACAPPAGVSSASSPKQAPGTGSILSGRSILSILSAQPETASAPTEEEVPEEEETAEIDDTVEEVLVKGCARFARELMEKRPRMGNVFQDASVTANRVLLKVPNESSYDELMHGLTEMKLRLAEVSGLRVPIEFEVKIAADTKGLKPIKVEDRLRHLTEKNPLLTQLRQQLELDVE